MDAEFFLALKSDFNRFGFGQTENFVFGNAAFGAQNIQTFITFHNVADLADLAADAETGMLRHIITSYFYVSIQKQFS